MSEIESEDQFIRLRREVVIETPKNEIIYKLSQQLLVGDKTQFLILCRKLEEYIRLEFRIRREELLELYSWFNPIDNGEKLEREHPSDFSLKTNQKVFLTRLIQIMDKSNFRALTESEWKVATSSQYLLYFTTKLYRKKLDDKLFKETKYFTSSNKDLGCRYVIFRRGIGIDRKSGYFFRAKIDYIFSYFYTAVKKVWHYVRSLVKPPNDVLETSAKPSFKEHSEGSSKRYDTNEKYICVKRIHVSNSFKLKEFFHKLDLQEPTFDQTIILYRKATHKRNTSCYGDLGIHIKHYKSIPMADMELILPAKKHPRLPLQDWIVLLIFGLISLVGILSALKQKSHIGVVVGITVAFLSYCAKVYLTFTMNVLQYERRINKLMVDKQLDCGHGTLLYILDEAIQQEVKEAVIAYFVLTRKGDATEEELRLHCNDLIANFFRNGASDFEVKDAVEKLEQLQIISSYTDPQGQRRFSPVQTDKANELVHLKILEHLQSSETKGILQIN